MTPRKAETKEIEKLKTENAKLRAENTRMEKVISDQGHKKSKELFRKIAVIILIALATALLTVGNLLFWFGNTIVKPDRFVAATQPIIKDPKAQQAMALYTTNNIFKAVDVQKITEEVLPPRADFLAPQLTSQLKSATEKTLQTALAKPSFQDRWNTALANQHEKFINFATKYKGDGTISLNDVYNQLSASLQNTKLAFLSNKKLPAKVGSVEVVSAPWLPKVHNIVTNIDTWRLLSVITFTLTVVLAVWLSRNRRKALYVISLAISIFMLITLFALRVARETIAQKVDPQYTEGVRSALQIFTHSLVMQTATILLVFLLVAFVAWVSGSSRNAVAFKNQIALLFSGKLHTRLFGEDTNKLVNWVGDNKRLLEWSAVAIITVIMLLVRLTLKSLLLYALLMLVSILTIEVIAGSPEISHSKKTSTKP